jgi:hypothetical protein
VTVGADESAVVVPARGVSVRVADHNCSLGRRPRRSRAAPAPDGGEDLLLAELALPPYGRVGLTEGVLVRSDCRSNLVGTVHLMSRATDLTDMQ